MLSNNWLNKLCLLLIVNIGTMYTLTVVLHVNSTIELSK